MPLVHQIIGISVDEWQRMKPAMEPWIQNVYPLVDAKITRRQCEKWLADKGFGEAPRSACIICPYHHDREWDGLDPLELAKAATWERQLQQQECSARQHGQYFLHSSCKPIDTIDFNPRRDQLKIDFGFINECEGMCGV